MNCNYKKIIYSFIPLIFLLFTSISVHAQTLNSPYLEDSGIIVNKSLNSSAIGYIHGEKNNIYYSSTEYCSSLTELKNSIIKHMYNKDSSFTISYKGDFSTLESDLNNILGDIENTDDYLAVSYSYMKWNAQGYSENLNTITFNFSYLATKEQEDYVDKKVTSILSTLITSSMTDDDKEKTIHDYIVKNVTYDQSYTYYSAYDALYYGTSVCQGYALLAYKMLKQAGLNVRIITGNAGGESHAWNLVNVRGKWYQLDCTWDDPVPDTGKVSYDYYNINDTQMGVDHTWNKADYPQASSTYVYPGDTAKHVASVKIASGDLNLKVGQTYTLRITILPSDASNKNVSWYSSDNNIVQVDQHGTLTALSSGNVVITVKSEDGNIIDFCKVTVPKDFSKYTQWKEKKNIYLNKIWTITFQSTIDAASVNADSIYVFDETTQDKVDLKIKVSNNKVILTPNRSYSPDHSYYLVIEKSVKSTNGSQLAAPTAMKFNISYN
ncbi:Ig-like domain-containing protein [Clostridiaceae bacterium UIB06]|uniref:Ig-like domain-containing protein n=1 Tax=Clostridium thailandense TaxID=2794346 RepID=A0A949TLD6_9CLOT|nr:Ig-like domain-containing protein [Clostridium thailandense]MBV7275004.1 Ig-like domain-containing protein [Clostridium thailandense]MCH5137923.1 Ig-like domain-containing protein [Clostridiaceae bacterium UIB06]